MVAAAPSTRRFGRTNSNNRGSGGSPSAVHLSTGRNPSGARVSLGGRDSANHTSGSIAVDGDGNPLSSKSKRPVGDSTRRQASGHYIQHMLLGRGTYGETWLVEYLPQQRIVVSTPVPSSRNNFLQQNSGSGSCGSLECGGGGGGGGSGGGGSGGGRSSGAVFSDGASTSSVALGSSGLTPEATTATTSPKLPQQPQQQQQHSPSGSPTLSVFTTEHHLYPAETLGVHAPGSRIVMGAAAVVNNNKASPKRSPAAPRVGGGGGAGADSAGDEASHSFSSATSLLGDISAGSNALDDGAGASSFGSDARWQEMPAPGNVSSLASTKKTVQLSNGIDIPADRVYVCKVILRDPSKGSTRTTLDEINVLSTCAHPCILAFIESFVQDDRLHLITEYMDFGDLEIELRKRRQQMKHFSESTVYFLFVQLCLAVEYLHRHNIMHRDIKTANVLLSRLWLAKLCDFGFAKQSDMDVDGAVSTSRLGTPYYMAPEIWLGRPYSAKADMWSLGVLFYELLTLNTPFSSKSYTELTKLITTGEFAPITREGVSPEALAVVRSLLVVDPDKRLSAKALLQTPVLLQTLHQFLHKFGRAAAVSRSPIDMQWYTVLRDHIALIEQDPLMSSVKARKAVMQRATNQARREQSRRTTNGGISDVDDA